MAAFFSGPELAVLEEELRVAKQLLYMSRKSSDGLADSLKLLSLRTGWAIYLWSKIEGLANLKNTEPAHNKTQQFDHAIEFASKTKHFSVFVFPILDKADWLDAKLYLSKRDPLLCDNVKYLFLLPRNVESSYFEKYGKRLSLNCGLDGTYVLRDGRWVGIDAIS